MLRRKERNGGWAEGYHVTSANAARLIMQNGFEDRQDRKIREDLPGGQKGVYFSDKDSKNNYVDQAIKKSLERNDSQIAIIHVRSRNAIPDLIGRYEWLSLAKDIEILEIEYKNISDIDLNKSY